MEHSLFSQEKDMPIAFWNKFDKKAIKETIVEHLRENPEDVLEHCKEYSKEDYKRFYGVEIINFYQVNNGKPCLVITKGEREFYKPIN